MTIKSFFYRLSRARYAWPLTFILLLAGIYFIKPLRGMVSRITATEDNIRYVPHQAPDSSLLGRYEQVSGPFSIPVMNEGAVIIEDHEWSIDVPNKKYRTNGTGYIKVKNAAGEGRYAPIEISETFEYDSMRTHLPGIRPLTVLPPEKEEAPDTLQLIEELPQDGIFNRGLWEVFRTIELPFTFLLGDQEFVIETCKVTRNLNKSPATRETTVTGAGRILSEHKKSAPITMTLEEPLK